MANPADIISMVRLRGVLHAVSYTELLAAGDVNSQEDTAREIKITPMVGAGAGEYVVLYRMASQGILASSLDIHVNDLNRSRFSVLLPPSLVFDGEVFIGDAHEGVVLTVRNRAAKDVPLTLHVALVNQHQLQQLLKEPASHLGAHTYSRQPMNGAA